MKSFQEIYTKCQNQSGDDGVNQLVIFKEDINDTQSMVLGDHAWKFLETTRNITTEADTDRYTLFADLRKIIEIVTLDSSGEVDQIPTAVEDPLFWEEIQFRNTNTSDLTQYYYQEGNDLLIWPTFSTAGRNIQVRYRKRVVEMTLADYSTGDITSITNGASALIGNGTSWNSQLPLGEQWIRLAKANGDYRWYRVDSITDDTNIVLEKKYLGTTIAADTLAYTLGEMPVIPEEYQNLLFYRTMALYYMKLEDSSALSDRYWKLYDGGYEIGISKRPEGLLGKFIKEHCN